MAFSGRRFGAMEATMPYARARRFFLTPPSVPLFFLTPPSVPLFFASILLAILALLITYGYVTAIRPSYAFMVLLIGYASLMIGCLFRRV
jgi:hypothetical protein